jgi:hypothetical protein
LHPLRPYWFHLSAVFLRCPEFLARTLVTSCGVLALKISACVFAIAPRERRVEKRLPKWSILRNDLFMRPDRSGAGLRARARFPPLCP